MQDLKASFEKQLLRKAAQKISGNSNCEEAVMLKALKYYDLDNDGGLNPQEFKQACEKLGILIPTQQDLMTLFKIYDVSNDGVIQYKEFTSVVLGRTVPQSARKGGNQAGNSSDALMDRLRQKLKSRGAHGMIGLQRNFKIMDDNHSLSLDKYEFSKAMTDFMLGFNQTELTQLFEAFDGNRNGIIEYDEFLRQIRGPMNARRTGMVDQAFAKLDKDGNGYVDINDLTGVYNGKFHPDVIAGKKTERQVLSEWLSTFDQHHNMRTNGAPDHIVTKEEFQEYYNNISSSIDDDSYWEVMLTRAWDLDNQKDMILKKEGMYNNTSLDGGSNMQKNAAKFNYKTNQPQTVKANTSSKMNFNPPQQSSGMSTPTKRGQNFMSSSIDFSNSGTQAQTAVKNTTVQRSTIDLASGARSGKPGSISGRGAPQKAQGADLIQKIVDKMKSRGATGIMGMGRKFRIYDDNGDKTLNQEEFHKAMTELRMGLSPEEIHTAFGVFDRDGNGSVDYNEFLRTIRGEMNQVRTQIAMKAFNKMDKDGSGIIDLHDITGVYNAKKHPDVIQGKKTEDEILLEFLDTFEAHHTPNVDDKRDGNVSHGEWIEYYNFISMSIDDDRYFELMMTNAWKLDGPTNVRKAQAFQY